MSDANPILAELTRGNWVENRHRGAFVVADATGRIIAAAGDIARPVFRAPRSSPCRRWPSSPPAPSTSST